jgi:hypothetical protein
MVFWRSDSFRIAHLIPLDFDNYLSIITVITKQSTIFYTIQRYIPSFDGDAFDRKRYFMIENKTLQILSNFEISRGLQKTI